MSEDKTPIIDDETPTMKKLKAIAHQITTGAIAYETVIPQALITLLIVGGAIYLTITGQPIPEWLALASGSIIGFYFGSDYEYRRMTGKAKAHANK